MLILILTFVFVMLKTKSQIPPYPYDDHMNQIKRYTEIYVRPNCKKERPTFLLNRQKTLQQ